jgi:hypothetical protein
MEVVTGNLTLSLISPYQKNTDFGKNRHRGPEKVPGGFDAPPEPWPLGATRDAADCG